MHKLVEQLIAIFKLSTCWSSLIVHQEKLKMRWHESYMRVQRPVPQPWFAFPQSFTLKHYICLIQHVGPVKHVMRHSCVFREDIVSTTVCISACRVHSAKASIFAHSRWGGAILSSTSSFSLRLPMKYTNTALNSEANRSSIKGSTTWTPTSKMDNCWPALNLALKMTYSRMWIVKTETMPVSLITPLKGSKWCAYDEV